MIHNKAVMMLPVDNNKGETVNNNIYNSNNIIIDNNNNNNNNVIGVDHNNNNNNNEYDEYDWQSKLASTIVRIHFEANTLDALLLLLLFNKSTTTTTTTTAKRDNHDDGAAKFAADSDKEQQQQQQQQQQQDVTLSAADAGAADAAAAAAAAATSSSSSLSSQHHQQQHSHHIMLERTAAELVELQARFSKLANVCGFLIMQQHQEKGNESSSSLAINHSSMHDITTTTTDDGDIKIPHRDAAKLVVGSEKPHKESVLLHEGNNIKHEPNDELAITTLLDGVKKQKQLDITTTNDLLWMGHDLKQEHHHEATTSNDDNVSSIVDQDHTSDGEFSWTTTVVPRTSSSSVVTDRNDECPAIWDAIIMMGKQHDGKQTNEETHEDNKAEWEVVLPEWQMDRQRKHDEREEARGGMSQSATSLQQLLAATTKRMERLELLAKEVKEERDIAMGEAAVFKSQVKELQNALIAEAKKNQVVSTHLMDEQKPASLIIANEDAGKGRTSTVALPSPTEQLAITEVHSLQQQNSIVDPRHGRAQLLDHHSIISQDVVDTSSSQTTGLARHPDQSASTPNAANKAKSTKRQTELQDVRTSLSELEAHFKLLIQEQRTLQQERRNQLLSAAAPVPTKKNGNVEKLQRVLAAVPPTTKHGNVEELQRALAAAEQNHTKLEAKHQTAKRTFSNAQKEIGDRKKQLQGRPEWPSTRAALHHKLRSAQGSWKKMVQDLGTSKHHVDALRRALEVANQQNTASNKVAADAAAVAVPVAAGKSVKANHKKTITKLQIELHDVNARKRELEAFHRLLTVQRQAVHHELCRTIPKGFTITGVMKSNNDDDDDDCCSAKMDVERVKRALALANEYGGGVADNNNNNNNKA